MKLDWNTYLATLKPRGRLLFASATTIPLDPSVFNLWIDDGPNTF